MFSRKLGAILGSVGASVATVGMSQLFRMGITRTPLNMIDEAVMPARPNRKVKQARPKKKPNRLHLSRRTRRKHRRAA